MSEVETLPPDPDEFMGPRRWKITCLCHRCNKQYSYVATSLSSPDRPCQRKKCRQAAIQEEVEAKARNLAAIIASQRAPGVVGDKVSVKAVDETAKVVMEDYKFTDLQDNIRTGDIVAPKLPPPQQKLADGYFGGKAVADRIGLAGRQMDLLGRRALSGSFRNMAVNPAVAVPGKRGEPPLWPVRTEVINDRPRR